MEKLEAIGGLTLRVNTYPLKFKKPAKTSRDTLTEKPCFFLKSECGLVGECSLIPGLSEESLDDALQALNLIAQSGTLDLDSIPHSLPSVRFAVEMMLMQHHSASLGASHSANLDSNFKHGRVGLEINGLVWMADKHNMLEQVRSLKDRGFKTIKLKVGAMDFDEEIEILREVRKLCPAEDFTLRVDANGAFSHEDLNDTLQKLDALSEFDLHSIEQPIKQGNIDAMAKLCESTPIPIALDEELIGIHDLSEKKSLLETIKPQFIILKPSLLGGLTESNTWVELAEELGIGYWSTSALESNVGLEQIANWTAIINEGSMAENVSGLGTGSLYTNNIDSQLEITNGKIWNRAGGEIEVGSKKWSLNSVGAHAMKSECTENWAQDIADFLIEWFDSDSDLTCQTSGSTGTPKTISHARNHVIASALDTNKLFNINSESTVLQALPVKFIGGKLMLVRAIMAGANIIAVPPNLSDLPNSQIDFAPLTPHQFGILINKSLASQSDAPESSNLENYKTILLGGAPIPSPLLSKLPESTTIYEGFGMTETITHIAIRKISGAHPESQFTTLDTITLHVDNSSRLIIDAPSRGVHNMLTDDVVTLDSPNVFSWNGRYSNVINSGGIKIHPESLERRINDLLSTDLPVTPDFAIYGMPHSDLGEQCCLIIDLPESPEIRELLESSLSPLGVKKPRVVRFGLVERNENGKIIRPND